MLFVTALRCFDCPLLRMTLRFLSILKLVLLLPPSFFYGGDTAERGEKLSCRHLRIISFKEWCSAESDYLLRFHYFFLRSGIFICLLPSLHVRFITCSYISYISTYFLFRQHQLEHIVFLPALFFYSLYIGIVCLINERSQQPPPIADQRCRSPELYQNTSGKISLTLSEWVKLALVSR